MINPSVTEPYTLESFIADVDRIASDIVDPTALTAQPEASHLPTFATDSAT